MTPEEAVKKCLRDGPKTQKELAECVRRQLGSVHRLNLQVALRKLKRKGMIAVQPYYYLSEPEAEESEGAERAFGEE